MLYEVITEGISAGTPPLPESVLLLQDLSMSLSPATFTGIALWSLVSMMPEGVEKSGFVLTAAAFTALPASAQMDPAPGEYAAALKGKP